MKPDIHPEYHPVVFVDGEHEVISRSTAKSRETRTIDGVEHRIVRGDLHRHTELSWDVGPGNDGSYLDFYRYSRVIVDLGEIERP